MACAIRLRRQAPKSAPRIVTREPSLLGRRRLRRDTSSDNNNTHNHLCCRLRLRLSDVGGLTACRLSLQVHAKLEEIQTKKQQEVIEEVRAPALA